MLKSCEPYLYRPIHQSWRLCRKSSGSESYTLYRQLLVRECHVLFAEIHSGNPVSAGRVHFKAPSVFL